MSNFATTEITGGTRSSFARKLLLGASAGVLMSLLPAASLAQAVPAECSPGTATAGDTITCEIAAPGSIGPITTNVSDLTINIGSAAVNTAVTNGAGIAISMSGGGTQALNIASGSAVSGTGNGVFIRSRYADVAVNNAGAVSGDDGISILTSGDSISVTGGGTASGVDDGVQIVGGNTSVVVDLSSVSGTNGAGVNAVSSAVTQSFTVSGAATGGTHGLGISSTGTGSTTVSAGSASGGSGSGVSATASGTDLTINVTGAASGYVHGVEAVNSGSGALSASVGSASGTTGRGIYAVNSGTDLTVVSTGAVSGSYGVEAVSFGSGALSVSVGSATGTSGAGIYAFSGSGTDVTVTSSGLASGATDGIGVYNNGTGSTTVTTGGASGVTGSGIRVTNGATTTNLSIVSTDGVSGGTRGIYANNAGTGALTISGTTVSGASGFGVYAGNAGTGTAITLTGSTYGYTDGVRAMHTGSGALSIQTAGVAGDTGHGIYAYSGTSATGVTINSTGFVQGDQHGITLTHRGGGNVSVTAAAGVSAVNRSGVVINTGSSSGNVNLTTLGTVSGYTHGVAVTSSATGASVVSVDSVVSSNWDAMYVGTAGTSSSITATGDVVGASGGLFAYHTGSGQLSITLEDLTGQSGVGMWATNVNGTGVDVTITGDVNATANGINISNYAGSALLTTGDVTSSGAIGVNINNYGTGGVTTNSTGTISGLTTGLHVNSRAGDVSVTAENLTGTSSSGGSITSYGGNVTATVTGSATGGGSGLVVLNRGTGSSTVTVADAYGGSLRGLDAWGFAGSSDLTVTSTGTVSGLGHGLRFVQYGSGSASLTANNTVSRTSGSAIAAWNFNGTDLTINSTGTATGEYIGIYSVNLSGALTINSVDAIANRNGAIGVLNRGTDLTINSTGTLTSYGNVGGTGDGIFATHEGTGALNINLNNANAAGDGVEASTTAASTTASITSTGTINAGQIGVALRHYGSGDSSVSVNTVAATSGYGLFVLNDDSRVTGATVVANGNVSGNGGGIFIGASGDTSLTTYGTVTSAYGTAINAGNRYGSSLTITSRGDVSGMTGILASFEGVGASGAFTINTGNVSGTYGYGIQAVTSDDTSLSLTSTGLVSGYTTGVYVYHGGTGHAAINVTDVHSAYGFGINAINRGNIGSAPTSGLSITATGSITSYSSGVYARNYAPGSLTISTADVTSGYGAGIHAINSRLLVPAEPLNAEGLQPSAPARVFSDLTINVTGNISSYDEGILAINQGTGDLSITVSGDVMSSDSVGIAAINGGFGLPPQEGSIARAPGDGHSDVTITTNGDISGAIFGIYASNFGGGDLRIDHTGNVDGGGAGIAAVSRGPIPVIVQEHLVPNKAELTGADGDAYADLSVVVDGNVTGYYSGIDAFSYSNGDLSITVTGDVTGTRGYGIYAVHYGSVAPAPQEGSGALGADGDPYNDLTINVTGTVSGGYVGISATNNGTGELSITAGEVYGFAGDGVIARNSAAGTNLGVTVSGYTYGYYDGIDARNLGSGTTAVSVGSVRGEYDDGIFVLGAGTDLSVTATGEVTGYNDGIQAVNIGSGSTTINVTTVRGLNDDGIYVYAGATATSVSVTASGRVSGYYEGIDVFNYGSGSTTINASAVSGAYGDGVFAYGAGTNMSVTTSGHVYGYDDGVQVVNAGSGTTTISVSTIYAYEGNGIELVTAATTTSASVTASGRVYSYYNDGIEIDHAGSGDLTVMTATVGSYYDQGIDISNTGAGNLSLTSTGEVYGDTGILISNTGMGSATLHVADVNGRVYGGITAYNSGTSLSITSSGTVSGYTTGVNAANVGSGALTISTTNVVSATASGILAVNTGTDLSVTASGNTTGYYSGILAINAGSGSTTINANSAYGGLGPAIFASSGATTTDMSITTTGNTIGGTHGIFAAHQGTGALTVSTASVASTASNTGGGYGPFGEYGTELEDSLEYNGAGISAWNAAGTNTSVTSTGTISGFYTGITVLHEGSGSVSVTAENVGARATGAPGYYGVGYSGYGYSFGDGFTSTGISALNIGGTDLTVTTTGHVEAENTGIYAVNAGSGALSVTTNTVTVRDTVGAGGFGIYGTAAISATNLSGTDVSVTTNGAIYGGSVGIDVSNYGSGSATVTTNEIVSANWVGIFARGGGSDMTITAADTVYGGIAGIAGIHSGSGALSITATDVASQPSAYGYYGGFGIFANQQYGSGLSISVSGDISASQSGIQAYNYAGGAVTISTNTVTMNEVAGYGRVGTGIRAGNINGGDMSITATGDILAGTGVWAMSYGSGDASVSVGNVTAENYVGIYARVMGIPGHSSDLSVTSTGDVDARATGIVALNRTDGSLTVNVNDVSSINGHGIVAQVGDGSVNVTASGDVSAGSGTAINVRAGGSGSLTISANNAYSASNGDGVYGYHGGTGATTITTSGAIGGTVGVRTATRTGASINVGVDSAIYGSSGVAIQTATSYGGDATLTNDSVTIAGMADGQVLTFGGSDTVTVQDGATVTGLIALGDEDDTFNLNGGTIAAVRGGAGTDTANFGGAGRWIVNSGDAAADQFAEFEVFNFTAGTYTLTGLHTGLDAVNFIGGSHSLFGELQALSTTVGVGASLNLGSGSSLSGALTNGGTVMIGGTGIGSASIGGDFTQTATGELQMDVIGGVANDVLTVGGDINLDGTLSLSQTEIGLSTITLIDGGAALNGTFSTVNGLLDGLLADQYIEYDQLNADVNLAIRFNAASSIGGLTPNQAAIADALTDALNGAPTGSVFGDFGLGVASSDDAAVLAAALDELSPENADGSVQMSFNTSYLFMNNILNMATGGEVPAGQIQVASMNGSHGWQTVEGSRLWSSVQVFGSEQDAGANFGYDAGGYEISFGGSRPTSNGVHLGFAFSFASIDTDTVGQGNDGVTTDLARFAATAAMHVNETGDGLNGRLETGAGVTTGSNEIRTDLVITAPTVLATHTADSDFTMGTLSARFVMTGTNGVAWGVQPYVMATADHYAQEAFTIGAGQAYAMDVSKMEMTRISYSAGARFMHEIGDSTDFALHTAAIFHTGDTQSEFGGRFVGGGAVSNNGYVVTGRDVQTQYLIEGGVQHEMDNGFDLGVSGFAEFGDSEANGLRLTLSRDF